MSSRSRANATHAARTAIAVGALVLGATFLMRDAAAQPTAGGTGSKHGYAVYVDQGCYLCHGFQGQGNGRRRLGGGGGQVGPILAPQPLPYAAFRAQVRQPRDIMPAYSATILSERDLADIYAYLRTIPASRAPDDIRLLNAVTREPK